MNIKTLDTDNNSHNLEVITEFPKKLASRISGKSFLRLVALHFLLTTTAWAQDLPNFSGLIEKEGDAVVKISVVTEVESPGLGGIPGLDLDSLPPQLLPFLEQLPQFPSEPSRKGSGFGSGFIISEDGYVITNAHVVDNAAQITVGLQDQHEYDAVLVGSDPTTDIAVLKLEATGLPTVRLGDSDDLKTGQWVLAIGSPFGFEHTATQGIVSALARSLPADTYVPFIQTDVAVNPGNSGGPLFNTAGEVVGVNSQIFSRSGAISVANQIKDNGFATRGWLGVQVQSLTQDLAEAYELERPRGAFVADVVADSPAEKAGVVAEDVILEFNGKQVKHADALPPLVGAVVPGSEIDIVVFRGGKETPLKVVIEALEQDNRVAELVEDMPENNTSRLGVSVVDASSEQLAELKVAFGVVVSEVKLGSPAAAVGLRAGDVIASLAGSPIDSVEKLANVLQGVNSGKAVPMRVYRDGTAVFLAITLS